MTDLTGGPTVFISCSSRSMDMADEVRLFLAERGYRVVGARVPPGSSWADSLQAAIAEADAVIVVLDEASAEVYYEAGTAAAMGKHLLLLGGGPEQMPRALSVFPHVLTGTSPHWWRSEVDAFVSSVAVSRPVRQAVSSTDGSLEDFRGVLEAPMLLNVMREADLLRLVSLILVSDGFAVRQAPDDVPLYITTRLDLTAADSSGALWVVECKAYPAGAAASVETVQEIERYLHHFGGRARGLVVTNGQFSDAARHYATRSQFTIELWDRNVILTKLESALAPVQRSSTG